MCLIVVICMTVKNQKPIKFINKCGCIVDYQELERAILWYQKKPTISKKTIYMHGCYPAVSIHKKKIHVHRLLAMYWEGKMILENNIVHHIDANKLNSLKNNLSVINSSEHQSYHNKGKTLSEEHRVKISINNRLRKGKRAKPKRTDVTPVMVYNLKQQGMSFNQISIKYCIDWGCVKQRYNDFIHDNPELLEDCI